MADIESAPMSGQSVTVEALSGMIADSVSGYVSGLLEDVSGQIAGLEARVEAVSENVLSKEEFRETSSALSATLEEATLQSEEIGPVIAGELLEVFLKDEQAVLLQGIRSDTSQTLSIVRDMADTVEELSGVLTHPAMTTNFADYSVLEALLLLLVVWQVLKVCLDMLRGGFGWLR